MLKKEDFTFEKFDKEYEDYWFTVSGDTQDYLTKQYMEQSMIEVTSVVYSKVEDFVGVRCLFPFNYYVRTSDDTELKQLLIDLIDERSET